MSRVLKKRSPWMMIALLAVLSAAMPYLMGALAGQSVRSKVYTYGGSAQNYFIALSGGTFHSLAWELDAGATIEFQLGYGTGADEFWVSPAELSPDNTNPVAASGTNSIPVFIPVAPKARLVVTGAGTGKIVFSDS